MRQFGLYPPRAVGDCGKLALVREDRAGRTAGGPVVGQPAPLGSHVRTGEPLKASKRESHPKTSRPTSREGKAPGRRPGSGWDRVGPTRSRPRAPRTVRPGGMHSLGCGNHRPHRAHHEVHQPPLRPAHTPLTIRTTRLQSVAGCPPVAYQPARLAGVSRVRRPWDVSSRGGIPA